MKVFWQAFQVYRRERGALMSAALSFYLILAIAPLLAVVVGVAGLLVEQSVVRDQIIGQVVNFADARTAQIIADVLRGIRGFSSNDLLTTVIGFAALLWGATSLFAQLQKTLNLILQVQSNQRSSLFMSLERYALGLLLVLGLGVLIVISIFLQGVVTSLQSFLLAALPVEVFLTVWAVGRILLTFLALVIIFTAIYKIVPTVRVPWRVAGQGGLLAAILYVVGTVFIGIYFSSGLTGSTFGAASTAIVVLIWVYLSAQILLFGACFARVQIGREG